MRRWFGAGAEALERAHHEFRRAVAAIPSW
jgi:hypothetical protein